MNDVLFLGRWAGGLFRVPAAPLDPFDRIALTSTCRPSVDSCENRDFLGEN